MAARRLPVAWVGRFGPAHSWNPVGLSRPPRQRLAATLRALRTTAKNRAGILNPLLDTQAARIDTLRTGCMAELDAR